MTVRKINGGAYQYAVTFVDVLRKNPDHQYVIFNMSPDLPDEFRRLPNFEIVELTPTLSLKKRGSSPSLTKEGDRGSSVPAILTKLKILLHNLLLRLHLFSLLRILTRKSQASALNLIKSKNLDLVIFTMTHKLGFLLEIPTIVPIHDVQHRLNPQFPEVSAGKIWAQREYITSQAAKHASRILVDSEIGKEDVINCYHIDPNKIVVLPFLPPNYLKTEINENQVNEFLAKCHIPNTFLFYPAQFWPHKNHANLVRAIGLLKKQNVIVNLVLTGAKKEEWGTWGKVERLIQEFGLKNQVFYLGYVDNDEINILYRKAIAMAMPTFLGPTNIPVYEAWFMGCPVLYSDVRGCREQAGDAALLFHPANPQDMAEKIRQIWQDENLRKDLIQKGKARLARWTEADFASKINEVILEFKQKL